MVSSFSMKTTPKTNAKPLQAKKRLRKGYYSVGTTTAIRNCANNLFRDESSALPREKAMTS